MEITIGPEADNTTCFGCTEAQLAETLEPHIKRTGHRMVAMSLLSDAQELLTFEGPKAKDEARQTINRAKWVIAQGMPPLTAKPL